ncbi:MAG: phosphatase PAP2 family protein [Lachnospiraceae bacterium]|nr:phosphatase PAP2 family protein [Lachnospiraceae bacterium]
MKKLITMTIEKAKKIPRYGWILAFVYFGLQYGMYRLGDWISRLIGTIDRAFEPKIPFIDDAIPLIPAFAVIYLFSYVFWIRGPMVASLTKKRNFVNYIAGLSLAYIIGFLFFVFMPTCMDRVREGLLDAAARPGFFNWLLSIIYGADGSRYGFNLFPSYHCLISLYCYLGIRKQPEVSRGFRIYSAVMTVLICASTVFTKQHYFIDIPGGLLIALGCYLLMNKLDPGSKWVAKHGE